MPTLLVISDRVEDASPATISSIDDDQLSWTEPLPLDTLRGAREKLAVAGGYLERLPLACIKAGIVDRAEIWHHRTGSEYNSFDPAGSLLAYRTFPLAEASTPFESAAMMKFLADHGAPHILLVLGLGVNAALLDACANSVRVYNSIDAPALRVPSEVSARFDLVLTAAQWQSDEIAIRHPGVPTAVMPIGPMFAAIDQFRPLAVPKTYDLVYVAAAQPYKRHDILFDALDRLPRDVRALCVFGYGEMADELRREAARRNLSIDFVGPPGVSFEKVNQMMNSARFGVVCGRDDGAPAILTEYMLAGLPVLANAELSCGREFILPETGMTATPDGFADAIIRMRETCDSFTPRDAVLARWTWPHSIEPLACLIENVRKEKYF